MVQCEMCGKETSAPNRVKIEGAELDVCDECTDFGTEVKQESSSSASTKYSTSSSSSSSSSGSTSATSSSSSSSGGSSERRQDMFDEMDELAQDYDDIVRTAREDAGMSQEDLARQLNEKASLIRKIERGDTLPSDEIQRKLESALEVDLSAGGTADESDWSSDSSTGEYTLGDVVERKDS